MAEEGSAPHQPRLTISLVTFNGRHWLPGCLASVGALRRSNAADFELVVLDNASTDGTAELLREHLPSIPGAQLIESTVNLGYAAGHNRIIRQASSDFVLLLNQDVELEAGFAEACLAAFDERPRVGAVQARIRRLASDGARLETLDTTGLVMGRDRRFMSRSQGAQDDVDAEAPGPVFGVDGPAPMYRRSALMDAQLPRTGGGWEVLDEDFFMYKEDVDLAWRLHLLGWQTWYEPGALAWHGRTSGAPAGYSLLAIIRLNRATPHWITALSWRNQRLMQVKNESLAGYLRDLPWILRREALSLGYIVVANPRRLTAVPAMLRALPAAASKRRYLRRRLAARSGRVRAGEGG